MLSDAKMCAATAAPPKSPISCAFNDLNNAVDGLSHAIARAEQHFEPVSGPQADSKPVASAIPGGSSPIHTVQLALLARVEALRDRVDQLVNRSTL